MLINLLFEFVQCGHILFYFCICMIKHYLLESYFFTMRKDWAGNSEECKSTSYCHKKADNAENANKKHMLIEQTYFMLAGRFNKTFRGTFHANNANSQENNCKE